MAVPLVARAASWCGYITRGAIANERLALNRAGEVVLQLKSPYHDGTTPVVMSRLELLQRLDRHSPPARRREPHRYACV
ncbi:MAG: transposase [Gammaproteobacteria bacterium]